MFFTIIEGSFTKALLVIDAEGCLHYASLGNYDTPLKSEMYQYFKKLKIPVDRLHDPISYQIKTTIQCYSQILENPTTQTDIKVKLRGTPLQLKVWEQLLKTPNTISYKELANQVGSKGIRAVASAVGANKIAIVVPCHRVLNSKGENTGYRWGKPIKDKLLERERL